MIMYKLSSYFINKTSLVLEHNRTHFISLIRVSMVSGEVTLPILCLPPFSKVVCPLRKEFAPIRSKFFPLRGDTLLGSFVTRKANKKTRKLFLFAKIGGKIRRCKKSREACLKLNTSIRKTSIVKVESSNRIESHNRLTVSDINSNVLYSVKKVTIPTVLSLC